MMSDDRPILPAVIGMPRSASRMTWQTLKFLMPAQRPEWWAPQTPATFFQEGDWPVRRHSYMVDVPVIYTYRHPVEAYLSYLSRIKQDIGRQVPDVVTSPSPLTGLHEVDMSKTHLQTEVLAAKEVMKAMGHQWDLYRVLMAEAAEGRKVLFLKYEDYYDDPHKRVEVICDFMKIEVPDEERVAEILKFTSLEANAKRGKAIQDYLPNAIFGHGFHPTTGIQKGHVNMEIMGRPGAHLTSDGLFVASVLHGIQPAYQALKEMCEYFGYDPGSVSNSE